MRLHAYLALVGMVVLFLIACGGGDESPTAPTYPTGKPTGVTVRAGSQSATLTWNPVAGASGYFVYISTNGTNFSRYTETPIQTTTFQVLNLVNGKTYYFGVSAVGAGGWETSISYPGGSATAVAVVPSPPTAPGDPEVGVPPAPPKNLQGVAQDAAVEIWWDPNTESDFAFYRVYRVSDKTQLVADNQFLPRFRDTDLINGATYKYYVTAVDDEDTPHESERSNVVTLIPMDLVPEPIKGLEIYVSAGRVLLEWDAPKEADIVEFAIERVEGVEPVVGAEIVGRFIIDKPVNGSDNPHIYANGMIQTFVDAATNRMVLRDMSVTVGVVYTYRISAIDDAGHEGPPAQITAPYAVF